MKQKTDMIQKMTIGGKLLKLPHKAAQNTPKKLLIGRIMQRKCKRIQLIGKKK